METEHVVREIARRYFEALGRPVSFKKGAGPDILHEGIVIEMKGKPGLRGKRRRKSIHQFATYAFEHTGLEVFFPLDSLDLALLASLYALEAAVHNLKLPEKRPVVLYLATQLQDSRY